MSNFALVFFKCVKDLGIYLGTNKVTINIPQILKMYQKFMQNINLG